MSQVMEQRQKLDAYLDGMLDAASQRELEAALAADPAAAKLLARIKSERALRAAAYDSYTPTAQESSRFAAQVMAAAHQPVGRIGPWQQMRRLAGIAAAIAVLVGTFYVGQATAPVSKVVVPQDVASVKTVYRVVYVDSDGIQRESDDLANLDELHDYINKQTQSGSTVAYVDSNYISPGRM